MTNTIEGSYKYVRTVSNKDGKLEIIASNKGTEYKITLKVSGETATLSSMVEA